MKALLISNGSIYRASYYKDIIKAEDFKMIICADGGILNAEKIGITPQIIIGDFDSADAKTHSRFKNSSTIIITLPAEKDQTDTEAAIEYCIDKGCNEITMIGCLGSRIDHSLANIYLLKKLLDKGINGTIIDEKNYIYLINKETKIIGKKGKTLSLLPFSDTVSGIKSKGLYYQLDNTFMTKDNSYGVSNVIIANTAEINLNKGDLLVIISKD